MFERIFDPAAMLILAGFTVAGFMIGAIIGAVKRESGAAPFVRGAEAAVLAFLGGLIARAFISILLGTAKDSPGAGLAVGWGFFLIPGIVDTIPFFLDTRILTKPEVLLMFATIVGAFSAMMNGLWRIYDWRGLGWLSFPLDVTWALAGNTIGCLVHLINFTWGKHGEEIRLNAHRYKRGFRLKGDDTGAPDTDENQQRGYAFTQGAVMSNLAEKPGDDLYRHEKTHVWQGRAFGPMFTLTYMGWMAVWAIPGLIAGAIVKAGIFQGAEKWCYFDNPWETWAYAVQKLDRADLADTSEQKRLIWRAIFVILWAIPFFGLATFLAILTVVSIWG